ncbi:hypothetical protein DMB65_13890 [Flavobacterium cheongpyeongense]|uniref:Uncharacterized protein n=1 Tax=Flavobacterium cheongpyeongense TaxID=2212651 RepID=A0A2V4C1Q7_9FLAO|nr:hypothetical protein [Flavobacterium cheongpyeongense]PXY40154.1 hypothetical protein DMB65_13890 [Flavobacterium cheongpyeongense]
MKNLLLYLFALFAFLESCSTEEAVKNEQNLAVTETNKWFEESGVNIPILHYTKSIKWEDAIVSKNEFETIIEVPLLLNEKLKVQNGVGQTYMRLLFTKNKESKFQVYQLVLSTSKEFDNGDKNLSFEGLLRSFEGNINLVNTKGEVVDPVTKISKKHSSNPTGREEQTCTYLIEMYDDGSYDLIEKLFCGGAGGGTGTSGVPPKTGGAGGGGGTSTEETAPPSCESFNFTSKEGANWQEAVVKNINFRIVILDNKGIRVSHYVSFPQGVLFGMAINFHKGNGDVTPGAAATVSAMVLNKVMDAMDKKYALKNVSDMILHTEFQTLLKAEYRTYTNGGTVNFNTTSTLPATNYKTNRSETGICD